MDEDDAEVAECGDGAQTRERFVAPARDGGRADELLRGGGSRGGGGGKRKIMENGMKREGKGRGGRGGEGRDRSGLAPRRRPAIVVTV